MKRIFHCILISLLAINVFAADEVIVKSSISNVTVFASGAQIFRKANYTIKPGISKIIFENVSPVLDPKSIQVNGTGSIVILDTKFTYTYRETNSSYLSNISPKMKQDILRLEDSIALLQYDIDALNSEVDVLNQAKRIIANNGAVKGTGKVNDSVQLLKETVEYFTSKTNELNTKLAALTKKLTIKRKALTEVTNRLNFLKNGIEEPVDIEDNIIYKIIVTVQATQATSGKLDISYLVSEAGWTPLYDIKSDAENSKVTLGYKARVYQNSREKWEDVKLTISTSNPMQNKTKPTLHPWYVDYNSYKNSVPNLATPNYANNMQVGIINKEMATSKREDILLEKGKLQTSDEFVQVVQNMIAADFVISLPYTIESNGEEHIVLISNNEMTANFKYFSVPKLEKSAYLVAQVTKLEELQLVPGTANIYFNGSYLGESYLNPMTLEDTLNLSLGKDPNIIVKRVHLKEETKEKLIGSSLEKSYSYLIEIKNQKSSTIDITIQDQLPITTNGDIEITAIDLAKGKYNETTGLIEWSVKIKPGQSHQLKFSFKIKTPKDKPLKL